MSSEIVIRRANAADSTRLGELAGALVRMHHAVDPERFLLFPNVEEGYGRWLAREMNRPEAVVLVAARGDRVVGYVYGTLEGTDWNRLLEEHGAIHDVFVDELERRAGVGADLVDALLRELEGLGARRIVLSTMVSNDAAQKLFESRGFRRTMVEMTRSPG